MIHNIFRNNVLKNSIHKLKRAILIFMCVLPMSFIVTANTSFAGGLTIITHGHLGTTTGWVDWMEYSIVKKITDQNASVAVYTLKIHRDGTSGITRDTLSQESIQLLPNFFRRESCKP